MTAVLEVRDLTVRFRNGKRLTSLVEGVSFTVRRGGCLGILGESGSGKSMSCKAVLGLLDDNFQVEGSALFEGRLYTPRLLETDGARRRDRRARVSLAGTEGGEVHLYAFFMAPDGNAYSTSCYAHVAEEGGL